MLSGLGDEILQDEFWWRGISFVLTHLILSEVVKKLYKIFWLLFGHI